ncbi:MAG TPA: hypothetical protein VLZ81_09495 [Blastocatellia bacterium]|nr:hypothetical protein [Blastocatellia bacterium]
MAEGTNVAARSRSTDDVQTERSSEAIRHDLAAKRDAISETVDRLSYKVEETLDWRTHVSHHPFAALGVAALGGLLVSRLFVRRPSPTDRIRDALADIVEEVGGQARGRINDALGSRAVAGSAIKAVAAGLISRAAVEIISSKFNSSGWPGAEPEGVSYRRKM